MPHSSRLRIAIVWIGVLLVAAFTVALQRVRSDESAAIAGDEGGPVEVDEAAERFDIVPTISMQNELVGKLTMGLRALAPTFPPASLLENAAPLAEGNAVDQLAYAVLVGSVEGWEQGAVRARAVVVDPESPTIDAELALQADVVAALEVHSAKSDDGDPLPVEVDAPTLERIEASLGYFGRLLGPDGAADEAATTLVVIIIVGIWYLAVFLIGSGVLVTIAIMAIGGKLRPRFEPTSDTHAGIVLGEVFLVWLVAFLALSVFVEIALSVVNESVAVHLACSMLAMLSSLLVLLFAPARGVSWSQLRTMIGLHRGEGFVKEVLLGIGCYVSAVPILAGGMLIYILLNFASEAMFGKNPPPTHPAVEMLGGAQGLGVVMLFLLASVVAPIVEETVFRGLLYGHLRAVVAPRLRFISLMIAAVGSSFIFAVVHPQGLLFVPALGGLAVGFCIFRELRGSLVAPMVAHGVNNAVTLTIGLTLLS